MKQMLASLQEASLSAIAQVTDLQTLENLRIQYLGKKGKLTSILKQMGTLSPEERPVIGELSNTIRKELEETIAERRVQLEAKALEQRLLEETIDVTIPGASYEVGKKHPITKVLDEAKDIFIGMGFQVAEGPEIELSSYNFDKLNAKAGHPSRDRQDTFYFDDADALCLRTQTSPVQARVMETHPLPIRVISPGRVFRKDEVDATHSPMFHQIEGLVVDKNITMGDLKGTLHTLCQRLYGAGIQTRFRPHYFPFTEPSCEVDLQCFECGGTGCRVCKGEGWIELLGAGMVHPNVLRMCGVDPEVYSGFAFGIGVERMTMMRFNISDMRLLYENDLRFLSQF